MTYFRLDRSVYKICIRLADSCRRKFAKWPNLPCPRGREQVKAHPWWMNHQLSNLCVNGHYPYASPNVSRIADEWCNMRLIATSSPTHCCSCSMPRDESKVYTRILRKRERPIINMSWLFNVFSLCVGFTTWARGQWVSQEESDSDARNKMNKKVEKIILLYISPFIWRISVYTLMYMTLL